MCTCVRNGAGITAHTSRPRLSDTAATDEPGYWRNIDQNRTAPRNSPQFADVINLTKYSLEQHALQHYFCIEM